VDKPVENAHGSFSQTRKIGVFDVIAQFLSNRVNII